MLWKAFAFRISKNGWKYVFIRVCLFFQKQSPEVYYKKTRFKSFTKVIGKHLCQSLFGRLYNLSKKRLWRRLFPMNFEKFFRIPSRTQNTPGQLLLLVRFQRLIFCYRFEVVVLNKAFTIISLRSGLSLRDMTEGIISNCRIDLYSSFLWATRIYPDPHS